MTRRKCETCRHFADAGFAGSGWCRHPERQIDALVMVRKNGLGCNKGWKKDLWEPLTGEPGLPGGESLARPALPASPAEIAAAAMHTGPLASGAGDLQGKQATQEDVLVGQQPLFRGLERPRESPPPIPDARSAALSRDPADAIRRAHDVFREEAMRRSRRAESPLPLPEPSPSALTSPAGSPEMKPSPQPDLTEAGGDGDVVGRMRSQAEPAARSLDARDELPEPPVEGVSPEAISERATGADAMAPPATSAERPSRWTMAPSRGAQHDGISSELTGEGARALGEDLAANLVASSTDHAPGLSSVPPRPARMIEQPTSLARHRWPPRASDDPGFFPERVPEESHGATGPHPRDRAVDAQDRDDSDDDGVRSSSGIGERREWQQRWQSRSLLRSPDQEPGDGADSPQPPADEIQRDPAAASDHVLTGSNAHTSGDETTDGEPGPEPALRRAVAARGHASGGESSGEDDDIADHRFDQAVVGTRVELAEPDDTLVARLTANVAHACATCRDFRPADSGDRGWCTNDWAFSHRHMVNAEDCPCASTLGSWWLPHERIWLEPVDVQGHGLPTPLLDTYLPGGGRERVARRRS
ncbi:MAG TPA: hypothetical protein VGR16_09975 [Thermomicrobiales bacterium]|nr:hypothetical protein [Thermomicrobiales bacterium]